MTFSKHIILFVSVFFCLSIANAESIFAPGGIGYSTRSLGVRSLGLGGAGLALADSMYINVNNPASWQSTGITRFNVGFKMYKNKISSEYNNDLTDGTDLPGISLAMPLYKTLGMGVYYQTLYDHRYLISVTDTAENLPNNPPDSSFTYRERNQGKGGLSRAGFVLGAKTGKFSYGVSGDFYFGKLEDYWQIIFEEAVLDTSSQYIQRDMFGFSMTLGMIYDYNQNISLGTSFTLPVRLDTDLSRKISYGAWYDEDSALYFELPFKVSFGTVLTRKRYRAYIDAGYEFWDNTSRDWAEADQGLQPYENCMSFAVGLERLPLSGALDFWMEKLIYRTGFHYDEHYFQVGGEKVTEYGFALGLGAPLKTRAGIIDFALTYDKRGSESKNGISESAYGLQIGWYNRERWFVRSRH